MAELGRETRDLVLAPYEHAHVQDQTKGEISTFVGPHNVTLSGNDIPMLFDERTKAFVRAEMSTVKQSFITAPAGWYAELLNPAKDSKHPKVGKNSTPDEMQIGKRVVIPGPCAFALWPGQMARVIKGHRLRSNEYLVIEVYDAEAASDNWSKATVQQAILEPAAPPAGASQQAGTEPGASPAGTSSAAEGRESEGAAGAAKTSDAPARPELTEAAKLLGSVPKDLANGKRYVVKGTDYAFYIPPSGVKVVKEKDGEYIRLAVTLEKLEYAILLDENGEKEYAYGPKVVFPQPSQSFVVVESKNKFRAIELDSRKGVYIKVIEDYEDGEERIKAGTELFITGDGIIYFPRKEHSIIRYGKEELHHAIAIPKGEGRYILDRSTGEVNTVKGPKMLLPDPRKTVATRRILTAREVNLFYPGNSDALKVNLELAKKFGNTTPQAVAESESRGLEAFGAMDLGDALGGAKKALASSARFAGDAFERQNTFTEPRTIVLDTKYNGAVLINVWTGYAVKVVDKTGKGRVEVGPTAILLEYDESLEPMQLSTGTPKNSERTIETGYLKVAGNKVSDKVKAVTADLVEVEVLLSYRVNFEGVDHTKWFAVENYVKFLCDHAGSVLKSVIKKTKISDLHANITEIVRDAVLGRKPAADNSERTGMVFKENAMRVYDVEVLDLEIGDRVIRTLLEDAQQVSIKTALDLSAREIRVAAAKRIEELAREELTAKRETEEATHEAELERLEEGASRERAKIVIGYTKEKEQQEHSASMAQQKLIADGERQAQQRELDEKAAEGRNALASKNAKAAKALATAEEETSAIRLKGKEAQAAFEANREKELVGLAAVANADRAATAKLIAEAFGPDLVQAINNLGNQELLKVLAETFGDLSILEGKGILATATRFLDLAPQGLIPSLTEMLGKKSKVAEAGAPEA